MKSEMVNAQVKTLGFAGLFLLASACMGQTDVPAAPALKPNPEVALRQFEPAADQPYELGRGDEIDVNVVGRPELSSKHVIGPDGNITMPIAGSVAVADKTREEASRAIERALSVDYNEVSVSISIEKYTSNEILLLGAVRNPGVLTFDRTPTLLEVISRGGVAPETNNVGSGGSGSMPSGIPEECMIYRGSDTMITVELKALLDSGSPLANMRLKRNDIVYVLGRTKYISILGQVTHPGNLRLEPTTTLPELIAEAGGPTEKAGRNPDIEIIHAGSAAGPATKQIVPYKDMLHKGFADVTIRSGDIIYVPQSGFNSAAYTFEQIAPLVNLFTVGSLLANTN